MEPTSIAGMKLSCDRVINAPVLGTTGNNTWPGTSSKPLRPFAPADPGLPGADRELSFYGSESYWHGKGSALRRYTLRLDGFVAANASWKGGELITKPFTFTGNELELNFATSAAGSLKVEIQDTAGKPVPGYTLADASDLFGDTVAGKAHWKQGTKVAALSGKPIRLRFALKDADLYSFQFTS